MSKAQKRCGTGFAAGQWKIWVEIVKLGGQQCWGQLQLCSWRLGTRFMEVASPQKSANEVSNEVSKRGWGSLCAGKTIALAVPALQSPAPSTR
jgi:hypothetical protein